MKKKRELLESGYTLITVIMTFACLSILGSALLIATITGNKMRVEESVKQRSFYMAESGLDIVYSQIVEDLKDGYGDALSESYKDIYAVVEREKDKYKTFGSEETYAYLNRSNGIVNEDIIERNLEDAYNEKIKAEYSSLKAGYDLEYEEIDEEDLTIDMYPYVRITNPGDYEDYTEPLVLTFKSTFYEENGYLRTVEVTYEIDQIEYSPQFAYEKTKIELPPNILLTKALASNKDIIFMGSSIKIEGDVYAKGREIPEDYDDYVNNTSDLLSFPGYYEFGGITTGDRGIAGNVDITGTVATEGNFQIFAQNSNVNVNGDLYCLNMIINDKARLADDKSFDKYSVNNSSSVSGASLKINSVDPITKTGGSAYVTNKLNMMGRGNEIKIEQDYYGLTDIAKGDYEFDNSSSILINADISSSSLEIEGKTYIASVGFADLYVYDDDEGSWDMLKLGESVALKGNYAAYGAMMSSAALEASEEYKDSGFGYDNIDYRGFVAPEATDKPIMYGAYGYKDSKEKFSVDDRINYFQAVSTFSPESIDTGGGRISLDVGYAYGAYLSNGEVGYNADELTWDIEKEAGKGKRNLQVDNYGHPTSGGKTFSNFLELNEGTDEKFDEGAIYVISSDADVYILGDGLSKSATYPTSPTDYSFYQPNEEKKYIEVKAPTRDADKPFDCLVMTNGNIYILGNNINCKGSIIAGGNIIVHGSGINISNSLGVGSDFTMDAYFDGSRPEVSLLNEENTLLRFIEDNNLNEYITDYLGRKKTFVYLNEHYEYTMPSLDIPGKYNPINTNIDMKNVIRIKDWSRTQS